MVGRARATATPRWRRSSASPSTSGSPRRSPSPTRTPRPSATSDDLDDGEVGNVRAGRLIAPDEGAGEDEDSEPYADDVGIDGAGASAEEAAMHVVDGGRAPTPSTVETAAPPP